LKKKTLRNVGFTGVAQLLAICGSQIAMLFLARVLTPTDFGIYAIVLVIYNLAFAISTWGIDQAAIQSHEDEDLVQSTGSTIRILGAVSGAAVLIVLAPFISSFFGQSQLTFPLQIMTLTLLLSSFTFVSMVRLNRELKFLQISISKIAYSVVWLVVALTTAVLHFAYWSLVIAFLSGNIASLLILRYYVPWRIVFRFDRAIARKLFDFGKYPMATGVVAFLFFNIDKLAIGKILAQDLLGAYFLAFTWGTMVPNIFTSVVNSVMFPTYVRIAHDYESLKQAYFKTLSYLAYVSVPISLGLACVADVFVRTVLGPEWIAASVPLEILSLVGLLSSLTSPAGSVFLAIGRPNLSWRQTAFSFVPYAVLLIPVTTYWGLSGVSLLMLAVGTFSSLWALKMAVSVLGESMSFIAKAVWVPFAAAILMSSVLLLLRTQIQTSLAGLVVLVLTGIAVYLVGIYALTKGAVYSEFKSMIKTALFR